MVWNPLLAYYNVKNACFSLYNGEICGFLSTFVAKILNWGLCFPNVDAKRRYDTERRNIGARTHKDLDGYELRVRFHQGRRQLVCQLQDSVGET